MAKVCVVGASGRLGTLTRSLLEAHPSLQASTALVRTPTDAFPSTSDSEEAVGAADVILDWAAPPAVSTVLPAAIQHKRAYVVGATALTDADLRALRDASATIPVLVAANFSLGVTLCASMARSLAASLGDAADYEIFELHHRHKKDAPSGTALLLASALNEAQGALQNVMGRGPEHEARRKRELGISAARGGEVAGEHTVFALMDDERIELTHRASSPRVFAQGALHACTWIVEQDPGWYTMNQVLGLAES